MRKKGFTLIELMGVIIILGVIALIAIPATKKLTSSSKDELYNVQISNIKNGLKNWAIDNSKLLPQTEGQVITITLGQLKMGGYIDIELKNPKNNKCFGNDMTLEITRYQKNYIYTVNENTGTYTNKCDDYNRPYIILNGNAITYVEVNGNYVDEGVIAKDKDGNDITSSVTKTISGSGNTIDTSKIGNEYTITYTITTDGLTSSINRTVIVRDTTVPVLTIPENVTIAKSDVSFDVMEGVTVTDNSGENIEVEAKSNISFGIPGDYTITYTATDSSGNKISKKRILTILGSITNGIMESDDKCILSGTCEPGTLVKVQVNDDENYNFYVIGDNGDKLTLIMDRNLGDNVEWYDGSISECVSYYTDSSGTHATSSSASCGPITALNYLNRQTATWDNIGPIESYDYDNNLNGIEYDGYQTLEIGSGLGKITSEDGKKELQLEGVSRARLLTYEEATAIGCTVSQDSSCPSWIHKNIYKDGGDYWLLTNTKGEEIFGFGYIISTNSIRADGVSGGCGVRPVIEISK